VSAATATIRLITAPLVGALVGAIEEGAVFLILTIIDPHRNHYWFNSDDFIYLAAAIGMIFGGVLGGIIGLVVALRNARGREGLWLGIAIGLAGAVFIVLRTFPPGDQEGIVALSFIPAGASIGYLSAVFTGSNRTERGSAG